VEWLRSAYKAWWDLGGGRLTRGRYFRVPRTTPTYPGWHSFGSNIWRHNDGTPDPGRGEVQPQNQTWNNGAFPRPLPPARLIGTEQCIAEGEQHYGVPPGRRLILGIDERCWLDAGMQPPEVLDDLGSMCLSDDSRIFVGAHLFGLADLVLSDATTQTAGVQLDGFADLVLSDATSQSGAAELVGLADLVLSDDTTLTGDMLLDAFADLVLSDASTMTGAAELEATADLVLSDLSTLTAGFTMEATADLVLSDASTEEADLFLLLHSETASKTVGNTAGETTLLNSAVVFPSAFVAAGTVMRVTAGGTIRFQNVAAQSCVYRLKIGSTTVASFTITSTNAGPVNWWAQIDVTFRTIGAPGSAAASGWYGCNVGTITVTTHQASDGTSTPTTSSGPAVDLTAQWNTMAVNNTTTQDRVSIEFFKT
jgi:hypothetical protein